ncbi:hypothetical protein C8J95_106237 [Elizabethkingia sp. YR214]|nr:hypothetical protein C8J95_106237 [Elizabethkingia sp. YR214]
MVTTARKIYQVYRCMLLALYEMSYNFTVFQKYIINKVYCYS